MFKIFSNSKTDGSIHAPGLTKRHTRFAHSHTRSQPQTRTQIETPPVPAKQPCEASTARPKRPAQARILWQNESSNSLADQLHSETEISVALLRRALPSRFAKIDAETRALAKHNQDELLAPTHRAAMPRKN
ncbi:hypothetical protein [Roseovarius aestuarii]|uniref:Uncharacterized protein n=1 Tax=Roseovarius aestuarii TaxID=475083 RepID=A0A1X7BMS8_9RHOB|nr:hypothetical protein [Roseovarius aestuarii]SMC10936.1 hypothetical protein ROA7745_00744 [Roseovarius aestuarii]